MTFMKAHLSPHEVRRISVATGLDPRAVVRAIAGTRSRLSTQTLVNRAVRELGIHLPTENTTAD
jgi:hypothetical protein